MLFLLFFFLLGLTEMLSSLKGTIHTVLFRLETFVWVEYVLCAQRLAEHSENYSAPKSRWFSHRCHSFPSNRISGPNTDHESWTPGYGRVTCNTSFFPPTRKEEKRFVMSGERGNNTNFHDQSCVISCRWCTKAGPCNNYVVVSFFLPGDWYGKMTPLFIKKRICWAPSFPPKEGLSDNKHECKSKMAKLN